MKTIEEVKALGYEMVTFDSKAGDKVVISVNGNGYVCEYGVVEYTRETYTRPVNGKRVKVISAELIERYHPRYASGYAKFLFENKERVNF